MDNPVEAAKTTLEEEVRLTDHLINLASMTRKAILLRSLEKLNQIGFKHQNAIMRLEIIRQTQTKILAILLKEGFLREGEGLRSLIERYGDEQDRSHLNRLRKRIEALARLNRQNSVLLEKQFVGVKAFQQVLDLVSGVDRIYDNGGAVRHVEPRNRIEESR
ncbi:MAG TPA: flagellar export chaperone FlgN [Acidobacteriota bacterium]|nr:flagellar export chaperone FlgN [Acidobacteriota bacterium]